MGQGGGLSQAQPIWGRARGGAGHLLIELLDEITSSLEDNRAGVILSAIDFSKAFNRLDHGHCLQTFVNRGASSDIVKLLAAFLTKRTMTVRVGSKYSTPKYVYAGAPQGSVLGCYLFNIGADDLEEGFEASGGAKEHPEALVSSVDFPSCSTPTRVNTNPVRDVPVSPKKK